MWRITPGWRMSGRMRCVRESWISVGARYCRDQRKTFLIVFPFCRVVRCRIGSPDFIAFIGFSGNKIEMLFVASAYQGSGIGSRLIAFAKERGMRFVDVNEQNLMLWISIRSMDLNLCRGMNVTMPADRPFPILHLMSDGVIPRTTVSF